MFSTVFFFFAKGWGNSYSADYVGDYLDVDDSHVVSFFLFQD